MVIVLIRAAGNAVLRKEWENGFFHKKGKENVFISLLNMSAEISTEVS